MTTLTRTPAMATPVRAMKLPPIKAHCYPTYHSRATLPGAAPDTAPPDRDISDRTNDERLMLAICNSDEWALEQLYERYSRFMYMLAYRIVQDNTIAEDIVQEAFVTIWSKARSYQSQQGTVRRWIQAIVYHRAIDRVRASVHRDYQWLPLQAESEHLPGAQADIWEETWRRECRALVHSALAQLPFEQRQVIELGYFGGYTHAEISERWHIPLGTVKGRMRLGLQKMKHLLHERGLDSAW
jgi:RNA polymerase sigma-70 factor (ECF subfamily)